MKTYYFAFLLILSACTTSTSDTADNVQEQLIETTDNTNEIITDNTEEAPIQEEDVSAEENKVSSEYEDIDWLAYEESMTKDFSFVILISTKSYDSALERAKEASEKLGYPLDLRELHPHNEIGLSLPKEVCEDICGGGVVEYPQYLPRNDWGETKYVSVEYSNGFDGFTPGYYIVVVASGEKGNPVIQEALDASKVYYEDAYAKTCGVWMGCGC